MKPYKNIIFLLFFFSMLLLIFTSCKYNDTIGGDGKLYRGNYTDYLQFTITSDTVNIVIEQVILQPKLKSNIPYSVNTIPQLVDTTKLQLFVSYGNNIPEKPKVYTEINQLNDTVYVWYSNRSKRKPLYNLLKYNSINQAEPSIPPYVVIDSIVAYSAVRVKITSRVVR